MCIIMSNYIIEEKSNLIRCCFFIALLIVSCLCGTPQAQSSDKILTFYLMIVYI